MNDPEQPGDLGGDLGGDFGGNLGGDLRGNFGLILGLNMNGGLPVSLSAALFADGLRCRGHWNDGGEHVIFDK